MAKARRANLRRRLLSAGGRRIGLYTSPHLYEWNERIRILPGKGLFEGAISDTELDALFDDGLPHIEAVAAKLGQPTEFEVLTFLGLWHFARQNVDAAVIEVGLGGKWDATNASDPLVSVVTHVALDHMDRLGDTVEKIAADKVCIARAGRPFVTGEWKPEVLAVLRAHCESIGAQFERVSPSGPLGKWERHLDIQLWNGKVALEVAEQFCERLGWPAPQSAYEGYSVPGRMEVVAFNPRIAIDGANNPDGAQMLASSISFRLDAEPEELILVLGILADKNWREMTEILAPLARTVLCCQSDSPRALPAEELAAFARTLHPHVEVAASVKLAVERARQLAGGRRYNLGHGFVYHHRRSAASRSRGLLIGRVR